MKALRLIPTAILGGWQCWRLGGHHHPPLEMGKLRHGSCLGEAERPPQTVLATPRTLTRLKIGDFIRDFIRNFIPRPPKSLGEAPVTPGQPRAPSPALAECGMFSSPLLQFILENFPPGNSFITSTTGRPH